MIFLYAIIMLCKICLWSSPLLQCAQPTTKVLL